MWMINYYLTSGVLTRSNKYEMKLCDVLLAGHLLVSLTGTILVPLLPLAEGYRLQD